jgi:hypothetical protein
MKIMGVAQKGFDVQILFVLPSFLIVCALLSTSAWFGWYVAPRAVARWAKERGYVLVRLTSAGLIKRMSFAPSNAQHIYLIVVRAGDEQLYTGMLKVGDYWWPSLSVDRCPIEARWDEQKIKPDSAEL